MMVEGQGRQAPKPKAIEFDEMEMKHVAKFAREQANRNPYRGRNGWRGGLKQSVVVDVVGELQRHERPVFAGMLGEYALVRFINQSFGYQAATMDLAAYDFGDEGIDLNVFGLTIQVKTRQNDRHPNLIKIENADGSEVANALAASCVSFCRWDGDSRIWLLGWMWTQRIRQFMPVRSAKVGSHRNIEVLDVYLEPMLSLIQTLQARRHLHGVN